LEQFECQKFEKTECCETNASEQAEVPNYGRPQQQQLQLNKKKILRKYEGNDTTKLMLMIGI